MWWRPWGPALATILASAAVATSADALTPTVNQTLENGTAVSGPCSITVKQVHDVAESWQVFTVDPQRLIAGPLGGDKWAPLAKELPLLESIVPDGFVQQSWQPSAQGAALPEEGGKCEVVGVNDGEASGKEVKLKRPGPYGLEEYHETVDWVPLAEGETPPTPIACAKNDPYRPQANQLPPPNAEVKWAVKEFCNEVKVIGFNVTGTKGGCPVSGDMSQWPADGYINQYDAGARLPLPIGEARLGGSACGPSTLLMAMNAAVLKEHGDPSQLPPLPEVFDRVMLHDREHIPPSTEDVFQAEKAVPFMQSLGWKKAKIRPLPADGISVAALNLARIANGMQFGLPVIASTTFGAGKWGETSGGHVIVLEKFVAGNVVVDDPAGNYFSTPRYGYSDGSGKGHYGPKTCGYQVLYPTAWIQSFTAGRYMVEFGGFRTAPAAPAALRSKAKPFSARVHPDTSTGAKTTAISVYDTEPGGADTPQSFYIEDPEGHKAGWVDGSEVSEIETASVSQPPASWTDPEIGDPEGEPFLELPPTNPRSVSLAQPTAGTKLHVVNPPGTAYALTSEAWVEGKVTATDGLTGVGTGQAAAIDSPALDSVISTGTPGGEQPSGGGGGGGNPSGGLPSGRGTQQPNGSGFKSGQASTRVLGRLTVGRVRYGRHAVTASLSCAGGSCSSSALLTIRHAGKTVTIATGRLTLSSGAHARLSLKLNGTGRRLLVHSRHLTAMLVVQQVGSVHPRIVLHRTLRI